MTDRRKPMEGLAEYLRSRAQFVAEEELAVRMRRWADEVEASAAPLLGAMPPSELHNEIMGLPMPHQPATQDAAHWYALGHHDAKLAAAVLADRATRADPLAVGGVPTTHVIVPREPTQEMVAAGVGACVEAINNGPDDVDTLPVAYRAMIAAATAPQAPQADKGPTAMSPAEQKYLMRHPDALLLLMDYHDQQQDQADSMDAGTTGDAKRAEELKAIGAAILRDDAEIWTDELLRRFGVNP